ncbi:hypothetical protein HOD83_02825 [Candidatus Woesearchaeota archaeon]|jgi:hypothetical protein|nr:hypothetical protein [Candidatus Woesearchaeota archaeon]MBT4114616.1 hypothetical protein [Candidatus Woesearchaeota archaeon]MBT4248500.1 hypothetical protein [Candidatus Woesearchaeota archaeon]
MRFPNILQKKINDIGYWVELSDDTGEVNVNDVFGLTTIDRVRKEVEKAYKQDANNLDPKKVSVIFSQVLQSLDSWKNVRLSA